MCVNAHIQIYNFLYINARIQIYIYMCINAHIEMHIFFQTDICIMCKLI